MAVIDFAEIATPYLGEAEVFAAVAGAAGSFDDSDVAFDWEDFAFDEE
jgi:hypothetical protein